MNTCEWIKIPRRNITLLTSLPFRWQKSIILFRDEKAGLARHNIWRPIGNDVVVALVYEIIGYAVLITDEFFTDITGSKNKTVMQYTNLITNVCTKSFPVYIYIHMPVR